MSSSPQPIPHIRNQDVIQTLPLGMFPLTPLCLHIVGAICVSPVSQALNSEEGYMMYTTAQASQQYRVNVHAVLTAACTLCVTFHLFSRLTAVTKHIRDGENRETWTGETPLIWHNVHVHTKSILETVKCRIMSMLPMLIDWYCDLLKIRILKQVTMY